MLPGDAKKAESTWQAWKSSDTLKFNLVKDAPLPLSSDLVEMEDMSDASLPQGTDDKTQHQQRNFNKLAKAQPSNFCLPP